MKHLKMLGLAAIAALGLMAFVGAGTASATTISTDAAGTIKYPVGTEIHSTLKSGTSAILETTAGETVATCTTSTVKGKIEDPAVKTGEVEYPSGTWITGAISSLTWGEPEGVGGKCSQTTDTLTKGSLEIMQTTGDAGTVVSKASEVTLTLFGVSCVYGTGAGTTLGTITGGEAPELAINAVLPKISGSFLCPSSGRWTATYTITSPHALHITS
jgi:hypothetical protein